MTALAPALQAYFTERLIGQRAASPNTIAAYRDHVPAAAGASPPTAPATHPAGWTSPTWTPPLIAAFLDHLEHDRGNSAAPATTGSPRSTRCSATSRCTTPSTPRSIQRVLAIPPKRTERNLVTYLTDPRSTRCSPPATRAPGPGDATTPCSR